MNKDFYQQAAEDMAIEFANQVIDLSLQIKKLTEDRDHWKRLAQQARYPVSPLTAAEESIIARHIKEEEYGKFQLLYGGKK